MKKYGKLLALLLAVLMVGATAAATLTAILPAAAEGNIQSDSPKKMDAWSSSAAGRGPQQVAEGSVYGIRMSYGAPFDGVEVSMPTWSTKDSAATLSIYKWSEGFETTLKSTPIASQTFDPAKDNAFNVLRFDEQPAGEYLVTISGVRGQVGVWKTNVTVGKGFTYMDGAETQADWEMRVYFTKTPVEPFLPCESANAVSGDHVLPPEAELPADSLIYTHEVMPDTWVFTDGLGRVSVTNAEVGDPKEDKTLAMFYWTWHTKAMAAAGYTDTTKLLEKYPEAKNDYNHAAWVGTGHYCFWNEPIYGFYTTEDPWVLRRHAELLANAGVDTVFTDNSNGNYTWKSSYTPLFETWIDAMDNGAVKSPKVSFLLPFGPTPGNVEQVEMMYLDFFRTDKFQKLWFYWDEKPMLMGFKNFESGSNLHKEILNFFTFRPGQAAYVVEGRQLGTWGWLSTYPQAVYYKDRDGYMDKTIEQMTVGVAVNHNYATNKGTAMNGFNVIGRSYTPEFEDRYEKEGTEATKWGYQFAKQFDYALEKDPQVLFITGWNEWTAGRHEAWPPSADAIENAFPDQFIDEYSRDLEMTKGELKDHYYYLLVNYVRKYKGVNPIPTPSLSQTIDMTKGADQWTTAEPYYAAYIGNTAHRDAKGYGSFHYTETSGRNDIIGARIARDTDTVWFFVECNETITPYTDSLWMNLYIDSDQESKGWETFDFIVNKSPASADTLVLEKFMGNGYDTEKVADVKYRVEGKTMAVEIPKSALGLEGNDYTVNFAWTDNVHDEGDYSKFSGDIMDFYLSGDVAPGARFKFSYISTHENTTGEPETEAPTEAPSADPTEPAVTDPVETPTETVDDEVTEPAIQKGCGSTIVSSVSAVSLLMVGAWVVLSKKKDE